MSFPGMKGNVSVLEKVGGGGDKAKGNTGQGVVGWVRDPGNYVDVINLRLLMI